ncbi:glucuronyl/N-acetylglucosaminyl transferase EXT2 [Vigna unguiculata]|uniref:Glucuronyl/N-acetylglucosaminyl transferase EXT2 n=1 Tax=Vigna unguiculata TaxID=3917 RepID=A0A4D6MD66_VIGUN|nr:glucuronyl/N-acetylglucosaminyl transferase EXT2 [Vigna unguiculata]
MATAVTWSSGASSSTKLFLFMVPLVLVAALVSVLGPSPSTWLSTAKPPVLLLSSVTSSAGTSSGAVTTPSEVKQREELVVLPVDNRAGENLLSDHAHFNLSTTPPFSVQAIQTPQHHNRDEQNVTQNLENVSSVNESYVPAERPKLQRKFSILDRTEAGLIKARAAIREARNGNQTQDTDYVPIGPMYMNANAFHRSYLEMEKQLKVYVYEEGEAPVFHNGPCKSIYSMEGNFIHGIEMNEKFRTRDPEKAHVFFLPFSVAMLVQFVYVRDSHDFGPIKKTVTDYINVISERYPYWNRSLGADHFYLACHDWGPETSRSVPNLRDNSIRVLCNANTSEGFKPSKDVSLPEINLQSGSINGLIGGPSASKRPLLAFFAGGLHGPVRPVLLEHWENKDEDMKVQKYLPKGVSYYEMLRKSRFCLCPSGYEVASPRVVEAIYTGCVPVLISDHYVPPFSDVLNWKSFSVEVSVEEIPKLKEILLSISPRQYIRMQRRVVQVRRHFEVHSPPKRFDVFHMILHSELKVGWRVALATVIGFLGSAFGTVGGVGGGGIFVPMLTLIVGFDTKSAAALSKCMIMGASTASVWYNLRVPHPTKEVPIIDYDLGLIFQPMLMLGITVGVALSVVFPYWLITVLIIILFVGTSSRSFFKGTQMWREETLIKKEMARQKATFVSSHGELLIDTEYEQLIPKEEKSPMQIFCFNLKWKRILVLMVVWVSFLLLQVIKAKVCSEWYWVLFSLQFPIALLVFGYEAAKLYRDHKERMSTGNMESICEASIEWTVLHILFCALCGILGGTVGGLLGSGGGFILGPLLIEIGVIPQVASATATFVMMFSSSLSVVEFYLLKRFPIPYGNCHNILKLTSLCNLSCL